MDFKRLPVKVLAAGALVVLALGLMITFGIDAGDSVGLNK